MTYELAKQLKDAGFPQTGDNQNGYANDGGYEPTLSELIAACGAELEMEYCYPKQSSVLQWGFDDEDGTPYKFFGNTLEEAVAELYLQLHK
jgi:hypothetical protein